MAAERSDPIVAQGERGAGVAGASRAVGLAARARTIVEAFRRRRSDEETARDHEVRAGVEFWAAAERSVLESLFGFFVRRP